MGVLREIFGPSKREVWQKLADQLGATYVEGGFAKADKVQVSVKDWTITLDTYVVSTGKSAIVFTRMRAPYVNADNFRFRIYRRGFFSGMAEMMGIQDLQVGIPEFDDAFVIQGNDESKLRALFANAKIRELIESQPKINFEVRDDEGWFGKHFPEGVDELRFNVVGIIKDIDRLKHLFDLFAEVLNHLCHIGSAYKDDPNISL